MPDAARSPVDQTAWQPRRAPLVRAINRGQDASWTSSNSIKKIHFGFYLK